MRRRGKDRTKTNDERVIELCPRAIEVLKRQMSLREQMVNAAAVKHGFVLFQAEGARSSTWSIRGGAGCMYWK